MSNRDDIKRRQSADEEADRKKLHRAFWTAFKDYCEATSTTLRLGPPTQSYAYTTVRIGDGTTRINALISRPTHNVLCELFITGPHGLAIYQMLREESRAIGDEIDGLVWEEYSVNRSVRRILRGSDMNERARWPELHRWLKEQCELFERVFADRVVAAEERLSS